MNPIVLYFASGESLYSGAALLLLLVALAPFTRNRWLARLHILGVWIGLALMVMACPPFPWWIDALFFIALAAWLFVSRPRVTVSPRFRTLRAGLTMLFVMWLLVLPMLEFPRRNCPAFSGPRADHLVVIGDSLSAGIDQAPPWPKLLEATTGTHVINLSQAGSETSDGLNMARKLTPADTLVLLEIGSNDLLSGVPTAEFEHRLNALLAACVVPGRTVIMFELPLLPHRIGYGRVQRALAEKYNVSLIPKRFLVQVLAGADATSDGLHLAPHGAQHMAAIAITLLKPVLPVAPQ